MNTIAYGVAGSDGGFIETSATLKGAKNHATRNGYDAVYKMHRVTWAVWKVAQKVGQKWECVG